MARNVRGDRAARIALGTVLVGWLSTSSEGVSPVHIRVPPVSWRTLRFSDRHGHMRSRNRLAIPSGGSICSGCRSTSPPSSTCAARPAAHPVPHDGVRLRGRRRRRAGCRRRPWSRGWSLNAARKGTMAVRHDAVRHRCRDAPCFASGESRSSRSPAAHIRRWRRWFSRWRQISFRASHRGRVWRLRRGHRQHRCRRTRRPCADRDATLYLPISQRHALPWRLSSAVVEPARITSSWMVEAVRMTRQNVLKG